MSNKNYYSDLLEPNLSFIDLMKKYPPPDRLYKYHSFDEKKNNQEPYWIQSLKGTFHLSRPNTFEDEYDCIPEISKEEIIVKYKQKLTLILDRYKGIYSYSIENLTNELNEAITKVGLESIYSYYQSKFLIGCLTTSHTNQKMWKKYSAAGKGYCIEYNMNDCFIVKNSLLPVAYTDEYYNISEAYVNMLLLDLYRQTKKRSNKQMIDVFGDYYASLFKEAYIPVFIKDRKRWSFENEWRVFLFTHQSSEGDLITANSYADGNINVGNAIKRVYIGSQFNSNPNSDSLREKINSIAAEQNFEVIYLSNKD